jgi:hypothetical protein
MVGFYTRFIPLFSELVGPLTFLKRKNVKFVWGELQELAFQNLKTALTQPPTLRVPNSDKKFILQCDSSDQAIAAVLNQEEDGHLAPIGYASRTLTEAERRYSIYEREAMAVVFGCEKFRTFVEHEPFTIHTDNQAVSWLRKHGNQLGRVARWVMRLAPFKFDIVHVRGSDNVAADSLSRMFDDKPVPEESPVFTGFLTSFPVSFKDLKFHQNNDEVSRD